MISALVLTLNEERNIQRCLESLKWCREIVVLDSGSRDRTCEIARALGARVVFRQFDNWAAHLNWALQEIRFASPWVYNCDADEVVPRDLREELCEVAEAGGNGCVAFRLRYKNFFMGRWIRHCGIYPTWVLRFYRPERVRWTRLVNPVPVVDGRVGRLRAHFHHYSFANGLEAWIAKHNRYSTEEAVESLRSLREGRVPWRDLVSDDPARRRHALKEFSVRLPCRPTLRFLYMYLLRGGFLDGMPGLIYCRLLAVYEYMIVLKITELQRREKGLPV